MSRNNQEKTLTAEVTELLRVNLQVILTGAPGTGKTFTANMVAEDIVTEGLPDGEKADAIKKHIQSVQFHPGYDYSDFVVGLKPVLVYNGKEVFKDENGFYTQKGEKKEDEEENNEERLNNGEKPEVTFCWKDGIFKEFADQAKSAYDDAAKRKAVAPKFVFLIDEINRADLSRVFGELFSLLEEDYRYFIDKKGRKHNEIGFKLPSGENFVIPRNLYIIGTMNDIDRSVESMDFALRRRFAWKEVMPQDTVDDILAKVHKKHKARLCKKMNDVNSMIRSYLGSEYQLGGAVFAKFANYADKDNAFDCLWANHIKNILFEYFRGRSDHDLRLKELEHSYSVAENTDENGNRSDNGRMKRPMVKFQVVLPDGKILPASTIGESTSAMVDFIKYVYEMEGDKGLERITKSVGHRRKQPLLTQEIPQGFEDWYKQGPKNYHVLTRSNNKDKIKWITDISKLLNLGVNVERL